MQITDEDLLRRTDDEAFVQLFRRHAPSVLRFTARIVGSAADSEDIVQETFIALWSKRKTVAAVDGSMLPWLLTTCKLKARNHLRKRDNQTLPLLGETILSVSSGLSKQQDDLEELRTVLQDVESLSPLERDAIVMCVINEVPYKDAARLLGVSSSSVAKRVERGRKRLRSAREERENGTV